MPIIQRAKRIVIAGDTHQLRHISFLAKSRQQILANELDLSRQQQETYDYRNISLMDHATNAIESQAQVGFLNEHFRSSPGIIAFSNERFYQNQLQVMRERPWEDHSSALSSHFCGGTRNEMGVNLKEIKGILNELRSMLDQYNSVYNTKLPSIGVLSPFRNQTEAIREALSECFDNIEVSRLLIQHQLRIGTAHSFQGEERDVMYLSLSVDPDVNASTLRFLEREDVFNVAITRAKSSQIIYHSLEASDLPAESMLGDYLRSLDIHEEKKYQDSEGDIFAREVTNALLTHGVEGRIGQRVSGVSVDLLLIYQEKVLGIDLIGYPGVTFTAVDLHRTNVLRRTNFKLLPLGYTEWCKKREYVIEIILRELGMQVPD